MAVMVGVGLATMTSDRATTEKAAAATVAPANTRKRYSKVLDETDFVRDLNSGKLFRDLKRSRNPYERKVETVSSPIASVARTYRTVCVRLCDGYYFPISASTTRSRFGEDVSACSSRCSAETRLFKYPTFGGSVETMTDLAGREYSSLDTAFLYRTKYDPSCKCRAHPWEPDAVKAHQVYATVGWQKKARRLAKIDARKFRRSYRRRRSIAIAPSARNQQSLAALERVPGLSAELAGKYSVPVPGLGAGLSRRRVRGSSYMGLGVKPKRVNRPRVRARSRSRKWKRAVYGGSDN
ncbi:MAG: DUF2865 domain-containing protein [Pseudomonadota bacterium]